MFIVFEIWAFCCEATLRTKLVFIGLEPNNENKNAIFCFRLKYRRPAQVNSIVCLLLLLAAEKREPVLWSADAERERKRETEGQTDRQTDR